MSFPDTSVDKSLAAVYSVHAEDFTNTCQTQDGTETYRAHSDGSLLCLLSAVASLIIKDHWPSD